MERRTPLALAVLAAASMVVAACGDDTVDPGASPDDTLPPPDTGAPTTEPEPPDVATIEHPTGSDEAVIRIAFEGGFLPIEAIFSRVPTLLVSGDGRLFVEGPVPAIYPGPLLPNVLVSDIGEEGVQELLRLADEHGLLAAREYDAPTNVADAPDTVVTINAGGATYEHRAYALGLEVLEPDGSESENGDRAALQAFVEAATGDVFDEGGAMGGEPFVPEQYLIRAFPVDPAGEYEIEPTFVDWPQAVDADLASASDCVSVPATAVHDLFAESDQLTFFVQDEQAYQLSVRPQLPGDGC